MQSLHKLPKGQLFLLPREYTFDLLVELTYRVGQHYELISQPINIIGSQMNAYFKDLKIESVFISGTHVQ
jgi:hypothetical protein